MDNKTDLFEKMSFPRSDFPVRFIFNNWSFKKILFEHHRHSQLEFIYIVSGSVSIQCGINTIEISEGEAIIINSNQLHFAQSITENVKYYVLVIDINIFRNHFFYNEKYIHSIFESSIFFDNKIKDTSIILYIKQIIDEMKLKKTGYELVVKGNLYMFLGALIRNQRYGEKIKNDYLQTEERLNKFIPALEYIKKNFEYNITLKDLANVSGFSVSYFCHTFKDVIGETPIEYINKIRLNKACEILLTSNASITEIAMQTGFSDSAYFCRVFKKQFLKTPKQYREAGN